MRRDLRPRDYRALAEFRYQIRRFLSFSEQAARSIGLESRQHQLMLAIKGLRADERPRIAEVADRLQIQHHSAVELVNRLETGGYLFRQRAADDHREILLSLSKKGERALRILSLHHQAELRVRGPALIAALKKAAGMRKSSGLPRQPRIAKNRKEIRHGDR